MRYQIKEAFDKFINIMDVKPHHLLVTSAIPNDIRLAYVDSQQKTFVFKYADGRLFLLDDINHVWFPLQEKRIQ